MQSRVSDMKTAEAPIVSGAQVSSFRIALPPLSAAKLQKALPHIMADYMAEDTKDTAFCLADDIAAPHDEHHIVLACAHSVLREVIEASSGKNLSALWPDYMRLQVPESGVAVLSDGGDVLARRADGTGFRLPKLLADAALADETVSPAQLIDLPAAPGFATGRFGPNLPLGDMLKKARRTLALMVAIGFLGSAALAAQACQNERQSDALEARAKDLYRAQFPTAQRVVNVEAQLRGKLGGARQASGFTASFGRLQSALTAVPNVRLETMRYSDQPRPTLQVTLVTPDFSTLELARRALSQADFALAEGTSEQANGLIVNELTLTAGRR